MCVPKFIVFKFNILQNEIDDQLNSLFTEHQEQTRAPFKMVRPYPGEYWLNNLSQIIKGNLWKYENVKVMK